MSGKLSPGLKLAYASGTVTFAAKDIAFGTFILFYYRQVLGLSGKMAGLALLIAMICDAVSDPVMGSFSDQFRSRWGRRHPFMLLGVIPLALTFWGLFCPPDGLSEFQLFLWLTGMAIALRTFLTVFYVPYLALGAELSDDYHERSSITTYRTTLGWIVALLLYWGSMNILFGDAKVVDGETIDPRFQAHNYWELAMCSIALILVFSSICIVFTRKHITQVPGDAAGFSLRQVFRDLASVLRSRNFRVMFFVMLSGYMLLGVLPAVGLHMGTFFWELSPTQLGNVGLLMITANIFMFFLMHPLGRRFEKHQILQVAYVGYGCNLIWFVGLRLLGVLPENGHFMILALYFAFSFMSACFMMIIHIIPSSMLADIVDEQELETGRRQEGVFFAANGFAAKSVSGFGTLFGGIVLDFAGLAENARPGEVPADVLFRLGIVVGPLLGCCFVIPFIGARFFRVSRSKHGEVQAALAERRRQNAENPPPEKA